jgi:hypothetical protein
LLAEILLDNLISNAIKHNLSGGASPCGSRTAC